MRTIFWGIWFPWGIEYREWNKVYIITLREMLPLGSHNLVECVVEYFDGFKVLFTNWSTIELETGEVWFSAQLTTFKNAYRFMRWLKYLGNACNHLKSKHKTSRKRGNVRKRNNEVRSCNHYCSGRAISIKYYVCVCCLRYPACNAHESYCHVWPVRL
jgi:hypothetical protein